MAASRPSCVRVRIRDRSNSAMSPKTVMIIFPDGLVESAKGSSSDCMPALFSISTSVLRSNSAVERARRSSLATTTTSYHCGAVQAWPRAWRAVSRPRRSSLRRTSLGQPRQLDFQRLLPRGNARIANLHAATFRGVRIHIEKNWFRIGVVRRIFPLFSVRPCDAAKLWSFAHHANKLPV